MSIKVMKMALEALEAEMSPDWACAGLGRNN